MVYPPAGYFAYKSVPPFYAPPVLRTLDPVPTYAVGSAVWVHGRTASQVGLIVAVHAGGRTVTVAGPSGWVARCTFRSLSYLGATPYRDWVLAQAQPG